MLSRKFLKCLVLSSGLISNSVSAQEELLKIGCGASVELCGWLANESSEISGIELAVTRAEPGVLIDWMVEDYATRRSRFDLLWGLPSIFLQRLRQEGLLRQLNTTQVDQQFRWSRQLWEDSNELMIGLYAGTLVLVTNPVPLLDTLSAPSCWADLADIKLQGKIVLDTDPDMAIAAAMNQTMVKLFGTIRARQTMEQIQRNAGNEGLETSSALMDVVLGFKPITVSLAHDAIPFFSFFSPLITTAPCEGTGVVIFGAAIPYYSTKPESASYFVDFTLSSGFQNEVVNDISGAMFSNPESLPSTYYQDRRLLNIINIDPFSSNILFE